MSPEGEELGNLKDIMIDVIYSEIAYAVMSRGGIAGMGQKLFAVPWILLTVDGENKRLVLDADPEVLDNSPGFDPDNWPKFSDVEWGQEIHEHYGVEPYWHRE